MQDTTQSRYSIILPLLGGAFPELSLDKEPTSIAPASLLLPPQPFQLSLQWLPGQALAGHACWVRNTNLFGMGQPNHAPCTSGATGRPPCFSDAEMPPNCKQSQYQFVACCKVNYSAISLLTSSIRTTMKWDSGDSGLQPTVSLEPVNTICAMEPGVNGSMAQTDEFGDADPWVKVK